MKKITKVKMIVSESNGQATAKVEHLNDVITCGPIIVNNEIKVTAVDHAIREMKARVLEADAIWIRSGGQGLSIIEDYFDITELKG